MGERHQVKRIVVKPGGRLSLQKHHHRSEHWIVGAVRRRDRQRPGQDRARERIDLYSDRRDPPDGEPGKIALELIEVQTGSYFGEDDIIRIEDDYRRS